MTDFMTPAHYVLEDGSDSMDVVAKILGREQFKGFLRGNALKYLIRYELKSGIDDLKKALDYIERLVELEEEPESAEAGEPCKSDLYSIVEVAKAISRHLGGSVE
ncbi:DUF3310 domain-containing protein [Peptoniphilus sp. HCN-40583]|uniref:DUF3310 domain-containing protein n=1 Tax=Peptoniphilus sp. HCN-40583 TaxID=3134662 RepID=UPI0030C102D1